MSVDIHWVVGQGTNVGKTTVAAALVRALSALGQRVVPFQRNELFFYEQANVVLPAEPQPSLVAVSTLLECLGGKRCRRVPLPFSLSRWRSEVADSVRSAHRAPRSPRAPR